MNQILLTGKRPILKGLFLMSLLVMWASTAYAQQRTVTGTVKDGGTGEDLPGVNVVIKGSSKGTITDNNGGFSIAIDSDEDVLVVSFIGYLKQEVPVLTQTSISISLQPDVTSLEEVVVVGYGEQKKSVVTGSISGVKATDLENMPLNRIEQALQGRTSGLTIAQSSGQPGSSATVRVRGVTTLGNNDPLWVVDGVIVDNGGIGFLNSSDIESMEVLKDAASQAIYGARAAAGVILVTTKRGKEGRLSVNYNGYYGTSAPAHKLDLLNATEYATLRNEAALANPKNSTLEVPFADPASLGKGTDWQKQIFNNDARRQNHEVSLSGGNDKSTYYASFGYLDQNGIVATDISRYTRTNVRLNSTHKLSKYVTFGQNLGYAYTKSVGLGNTNSEFGGPLSSAIHLDPLTPVVETDPSKVAQSPYINSPFIVRDKNGNPYGMSSIVTQEMTNPMAYIKTRLGNYSWANDIVGNAYVEIAPVEGLKLRTTFGGKVAFWGGESFTPTFYLSPTQTNPLSSMSRDMNRVFNWNLENTISYTRSIAKHNATILLGQGAYQDGNSYGANVNYQDLPFKHFGETTFSYGNDPDDRTGGGYDGIIHRVTSLFARLNYNYDEKYLLTGIIRRDGSTNFGANYLYGVFPSFSAGWVASKENFWPANNVVEFLKIRGGYGVVGNDSMEPFTYLSLVAPGRNYAIDNTGGVVIGNSPQAPSNPDLRWEETTQVNIGFEATLFENLSLTFDWYKKKTTGILGKPPIPGYIGAVGPPSANVGDMENKGVEVELGYKRQIGDLNLSFAGNVTFVENKILFLGVGVPYLEGAGFHTMNGRITRHQPGHAFNSFYGYKRLGLFQTQDDVDAYRDAEGQMIQPDAKPGDIKWADLNSDGVINGDDRTFIGDPTPNVSYGLTVSAEYKGIDLTIFGQGVHGNQIFQALRRLDIGNSNWQSRALSRWTGPGTSNDYPRLVEGDPNENFGKNSDLYLEDGAYFRLKTVQLGYTFPKQLISKVGLQRVRVYVMSENLVTFTKYTGYDPEIGGGSFGIDRGVYPQARSFMVGLNLGF